MEMAAVSMSGKLAFYLVLLSLDSILVHVDSHLTVTPETIRGIPAPRVLVPRVTLTLYYESLCPASKDFITNGLAKAVRTPDIQRVIDLRLVPWGNALLDRSKGTILCQHGERECYLNTIHACAIASWPYQKTHFEFINCVETESFTKQDSGSEETVWRTCCERLKLDPSLVSKCYSSGLGKQLELQYGEETELLDPPHEYVPWVVVNGRPIREDYPNFMHYICVNYKGPSPPRACKTITTQSAGRNDPNR